jgi:hypothetical protein
MARDTSGVPTMKHRVLFKAGSYWPQYRFAFWWRYCEVPDAIFGMRKLRFGSLQEATDYFTLIGGVAAGEIGWKRL